ncbi:hypothetical protein [Nonomuraea sp. 10N515B]|uniref:hypothetical protein n=1 Tax=Nonomuraea sp. 10N515B TaxID=3457422 RepID=UPI003FCE7F1F
MTAQQRRGGISGDLAAKAHEKIQELARAPREGKLTEGPPTAFLARAGNHLIKDLL